MLQDATLEVDDILKRILVSAFALLEELIANSKKCMVSYIQPNHKMSVMASHAIQCMRGDPPSHSFINTLV